MANKNRNAKNLWQKFSDKWLAYPADDPAEARKGYLLSAIALSFLIMAVIASLFSWFSGTPFLSLVASIFIPLAMILLYGLIRKGYLQLAGVLMVMALILFSSDPIGDFTYISNVGLLVLALAIVLSGLLIGPRSTFLIAFVVSLFSAYSIITTDPSEAPLAVFIGSVYMLIALMTYFLYQQAQIALTQVQVYAKNLERARDNLELEVAARTRELQTSFNISNQISNIIIAARDQEALFKQTAELLQTTFHLSHILIYTANQFGGVLMLQYGLNPQSQPVQRRHEFKIDSSIVGQAAATKRPIVINDWRDANQITPNSLLSETGYEMAVPMLKGGDILGVLDLHSSQAASFPFTEAQKDLIQLVANQLSIALNNFQLVSEAQTALQEIRVLHERLMQQKWTQALGQQQLNGYVYTPFKTHPLMAADDDYLSQTSVLDDPRPVLSDKAKKAPEASHELTVPVKLRGYTLGLLSLSREEGDAWTEDENVIIQTIAEQIGLALDSARLFEDTQRSAWRDQMVSETTAQVWSAAEIDAVMKAAVAQLGEKLAASEVVIRLGTEAEFEFE